MMGGLNGHFIHVNLEKRIGVLLLLFDNMHSIEFFCVILQ